MSAALVSTLVGLAASNLGILPHDAPAYSIVMEFILPLTIPLLLFGANLRQVVRSTGTLLVAFLLGSGILIYLSTYILCMVFGVQYGINEYVFFNVSVSLFHSS